MDKAQTTTKTDAASRDECAPVTLLLVGRSVRAGSPDAPPLYELGTDLAGINDAAAEVGLSRAETGRDGASRQRRIYNLRRMRSGPGAYVRLPSDSPRYLIARASGRVAGLRNLGLKEGRSLVPGRACTTAVPVDVRGRTSKHGMPNFVRDGAPAFTFSRNAWTDAQGGPVASVHDDADGRHGLVVTAALPRAELDTLVALWCCKVWAAEVARSRPVRRGLDKGTCPPRGVVAC